MNPSVLKLSEASRQMHFSVWLSAWLPERLFVDFLFNNF